MERCVCTRTYIKVVNRGNPTVIRIQFTNGGKSDVSCNLVDKDKNVALQEALKRALNFLDGFQEKKFKYNVGVSPKDESSIQVVIHYADIFHEWNISGYPKDSIMLGLKSLNNGIQKAH